MVFIISGYGKQLLTGPCAVAQTGERIRSAVPAKAIRLAQAGDVTGLQKLRARSNLRFSRKHPSHYPAGPGWTLSYGSASLGTLLEEASVT